MEIKPRELYPPGQIVISYYRGVELIRDVLTIRYPFIRINAITLMYFPYFGQRFLWSIASSPDESAVAFTEFINVKNREIVQLTQKQFQQLQYH